MRLWLAPWTWHTPLNEPPYWGAPLGSRSLIDLRSRDQCGVASIPHAGGLFATGDSGVIVGGFLLGNRLTDTLSPVNRAEWRALLSLPDPLSATTVLGALHETLTLQSDPTNVNRCGTLLPTTRRRFEIWIAGRRVWEKRADWNAPEMAAVKAACQVDYRRLRSLGTRIHLKWLGSQVRKFGLRDKQYLKLVPSDLPDEGWDEPETTITESFNTADSDTLGPDLTWTELEGDWDVASNAAEIDQSQSDSIQQTARADSDLSSDDHYAQITILNVPNDTGAGRGVICRKDSTATLSYYHFDCSDVGASTDSWRTFKRVSGTFTAIGSNTSVNAVPNDVLKGEVNGSTTTRYRNGSSQNAVTDTAVTSNLRCGLSGFSRNLTAIRIDNFEAADLVAVDHSNLLLLGVG